ncbi:unnamed protein product [Closterium sp. Naga37s-1]|nr:unnamed protein product [Closterium sp. Naga37s-1]
MVLLSSESFSLAPRSFETRILERHFRREPHPLHRHMLSSPSRHVPRAFPARLAPSPRAMRRDLGAVSPPCPSTYVSRAPATPLVHPPAAPSVERSGSLNARVAPAPAAPGAPSLMAGSAAAPCGGSAGHRRAPSWPLPSLVPLDRLQSLSLADVLAEMAQCATPAGDAAGSTAARERICGGSGSEGAVGGEHVREGSGKEGTVGDGGERVGTADRGAVAGDRCASAGDEEEGGVRGTGSSSGEGPAGDAAMAAEDAEAQRAAGDDMEQRDAMMGLMPLSPGDMLSPPSVLPSPRDCGLPSPSNLLALPLLDLPSASDPPSCPSDPHLPLADAPSPCSRPHQPMSPVPPLAAPHPPPLPSARPPLTPFHAPPADPAQRGHGGAGTGGRVEAAVASDKGGGGGCGGRKRGNAQAGLGSARTLPAALCAPLPPASSHPTASLTAHTFASAGPHAALSVAGSSAPCATPPCAKRARPSPPSWCLDGSPGLRLGVPGSTWSSAHSTQGGAATGAAGQARGAHGLAVVAGGRAEAFEKTAGVGEAAGAEAGGGGGWQGAAPEALMQLAALLRGAGVRLPGNGDPKAAAARPCHSASEVPTPGLVEGRPPPSAASASASRTLAGHTCPSSEGAGSGATGAGMAPRGEAAAFAAAAGRSSTGERSAWEVQQLGLALRALAGALGCDSPRQGEVQQGWAAEGVNGAGLEAATRVEGREGRGMASEGVASGHAEASKAGGRAARAEMGRGCSRGSSSGAGSGSWGEGECGRREGGARVRGGKGAGSSATWRVGGVDGRRATGAGMEGQAVQARVGAAGAHELAHEAAAGAGAGGELHDHGELPGGGRAVRALPAAPGPDSLHLHQDPCSPAATTHVLFPRTSTLATHLPRLHTAAATAPRPLASTSTGGWGGKAQCGQARASLRESGTDSVGGGGRMNGRCAGGRVLGWQGVGGEMRRRQLCLVPVGALMALLEPGGMVDRALMHLQKQEEQGGAECNE